MTGISDHTNESHGHTASGHSHSHVPRLTEDAPPEVHRARERAVAIAAFLTGAFMVAEVIGGVVSGSLALLADAGHMLTDFASLVLAWLAFRLSRRPADWRRTYGFDRFSVLAAFVNGLTLFAIAVWITIEAIGRLLHPPDVVAGLMFWVALAGLVVNVIAFWVLSRPDGDNLNVRAAAIHVMGDMLGSVAAIIASLVILWTGWMPIDPVLSILVVLLILRSAWGVVKESGHILLEGVPPGFDPRRLGDILEREVPGVARAHHIHAWSITQERPLATLEIDLVQGFDADSVRQAVKKKVRETTDVYHVTVEVHGEGAKDGSHGAD